MPNSIGKNHILLLPLKKEEFVKTVEAFEQGAYVATVAENFNDARQYLESAKTDLVIGEYCDYCLEVVKHIRNTPPLELIPVILLVRAEDMEGKIIAMEAGSDELITIPFLPKELVLCVERTLATRQKLKMRYLQQPVPIAGDSVQEIFMVKVRTLIEEQLANHHFGQQQLADRMHISLSTLQKKLRLYTDKPISHVVRDYRLEKAKELLANGMGNVAEVARKTGFNSQAYFSTCYKNYFGTTPKAFSQESHKAMKDDQQ